MSMRTLYGLMQSPWTERARWALEHHGVAFRYHEHVPMLGEPFLRRAAKVRKPTVPLLVDAHGPVMGSFDIARHAEAIGRGAALFPGDRLDEIRRWNDVAERVSNVGRAWFLRNLRSSREAQRESLPAFVPSLLRPALGASTALAGAFLVRKHGVPTDADAEVASVLRPALDEVRGALDGPYLLGGFTYADMTIACALHAVRPHESARIGPATRAAWTHERLAAEYADLLTWRDAVFRRHR